MKPPAKPPDPDFLDRRSRPQPRPCHGGNAGLPLTRASLYLVLPSADQWRLRMWRRCDPATASETSNGSQAALPIDSCGSLSCWGVLPEVTRDVTAVLAVAAAFEVLDSTIGSRVGCKQQAGWRRMLLRRHDGCKRQISLHKGVNMAPIRPFLGSASAGPVPARAGSGGTALPRGSISSIDSMW